MTTLILAAIMIITLLSAAVMAMSDEATRNWFMIHMRMEQASMMFFRMISMTLLFMKKIIIISQTMRQTEINYNFVSVESGTFAAAIKAISWADLILMQRFLLREREFVISGSVRP